MLSQTFLKENRFVQIPALIVTMGLMWLLPFLVHVIPFSGEAPFGAYLLPIFFASFFAAWLFHPYVSLTASLTMPFLNYALTAMPAFNMAILLSLELAVFSLIVLWLKRWQKMRYFVAPFAILIAKLSSMVLAAVFPSLIPVPYGDFFLSAIMTGAPGILLLWLLNLALTRIVHE